MNKRPETLTNKTDSFESISSAELDPNKNPRKKIYRTAQWRRFRARLFREQRIKDLERARLMYERNGDIDIDDYYFWLDSNAPLCAEYFREGRIIAATVLDHIKPIEQGGEAWDRANLQWLSNEKHQKKRGRERHQQ